MRSEVREETMCEVAEFDKERNVARRLELSLVSFFAVKSVGYTYEHVERWYVQAFVPYRQYQNKYDNSEKKSRT